MIGLIWAQARGGVIGRHGAMPWHLPEDLAHFRACTAGATVVMGRRTWQSFPPRFRPLPGRRNVVLTRDVAWSAPGAERAADLAQALALAAGGDVWVIGGAGVYEQALPLADRVERTEIDLVVTGDTVAPELGPRWRPVRRDPPRGWRTSAGGLRYRTATFVRAPDPEEV